MHHSHPIPMFEAVERLLESPLAQITERAVDIGPDLDLNGHGHPVPLRGSPVMSTS